MRPFRPLVLAFVAALAFAGCTIDTINSFNPVPANVRVINLIYDAATIDVTSNDAVVYAGVTTEMVTAYREFDAEQRWFALRVNGSTTDVARRTYVLNGDEHYTLVAYGTAAVPTTLIVPDLTTDPGSGSFRTRGINTVPTAGALDIYITAPGADIANLAPNISTLSYASTGVLNTFSPGNYQIRVTTYGTKTVVYDSGTVALPGNTVSNMLLYTRGSGTLVNVALMETTGSARTTILENKLARVRAVHVANTADALDVTADQAALFTNIGPRSAAAYATLAPGAHSFAVQSNATPGATLAAIDRTLRPATDTTIYVAGDPGAFGAVALDDQNVGALSGQARLRLVNLTADRATVDLLAGDTVVASAVTPAATPAYNEQASGSYTLKVRNTASQATIATLDGAVLGVGLVYTVYVAGTVAQPTLTLVQDR